MTRFVTNVLPVWPILPIVVSSLIAFVVAVMGAGIAIGVALVVHRIDQGVSNRLLSLIIAMPMYAAILLGYGVYLVVAAPYLAYTFSAWA